MAERSAIPYVALLIGFYLGFRGVKRIMTDDDEQIDYMARTMWGEARGEGQLGMRAVGHVIINRAAAGSWYGKTPKEVVLKDWQFSAWNKGDPNRAKMLAVTTADSAFVIARQLAKAIYLGAMKDITGGAVNYHAKSVSPSWAKKMTPTITIGNHIFYKE